MAIWDNNEDDYAPGGGGDNNILSTVVQAVTGGDEDTAGDNGEVNEVWMRVKGIEPAGTDASGQYIYKDRKGNIYHYDDLKKKRGNQLFNLLRTGAADDVAPDSYDNPVTDTGEHGILNDGAVVNNGAVLDSNPYNEPAQEWADTAGDAPPATQTPVRNLMQEPWAGAGGGGGNIFATGSGVDISGYKAVTDVQPVLKDALPSRNWLPARDNVRHRTVVDFGGVWKVGKAQIAYEKSENLYEVEERKDISNMHVSDIGMQFIIDHEGNGKKVHRPYNDSQGFATIGIGHLLHKSPVTTADYQKWGYLSDKEIYSLFKFDIVERENIVKRLVKVPLKQSEFDAIVSFVFNVGEGQKPNGHPGLKFSEFLRQLNNRNYNGNLLLNYRFPKEIIPRRRDEVNLFNTGVYLNKGKSISRLNKY